MEKKTIIPIAGFVLSAAIGYTCFWLTARWIEADNQERFNHVARNAQYMIQGRLKGYVDLLRAGAGLYQTTGSSREQFHRYVERLELPKHFPGVDSINFARRVTREQMPDYVAAMAAEHRGGQDFYPPFTLKPGGVRDVHEILEHVEPAKLWGNRFGFDILTRDRGGWSDLSRDTGAIAGNAMPSPILKDRSNMGMAMRLPVYRNDMPATTVAERRAAYVGSIGLGFSMPKLVHGVLHEMDARNVRLTLVDAASDTLLFDSEATPTNPNPPRAVIDHRSFGTRVSIPFSGKTWHAYFSTRKSAVYSGFDSSVHWIAGAAGFSLSMLLWALFQTLAASRRSALRLATAMTRELRESQAELELSHQNLRRLAAHADQIKEDERKRIAREIHDDLGQNLLALRIEADLLTARTSQRHPRLHSRALATVAQIDTTIKSVRQIINDLRPNVLDLGLSAAVEWLIADFRRRTGLACELLEADNDIEVDDNCATAFFRILQESLNNVSRHAEATRVQVALYCTDGVLAMTVTDNGRGMARGSRDKADSFGLVGIEERVKILGGSCSIRSEPGQGTTIEVRVNVTTKDPAPSDNSAILHEM